MALAFAVYLDSAPRVFSRAISRPNQRQKQTTHKVWPDNVSPDDVLRLVREREARELADTRTELENGVIANPPCRICRRYWFRVPAPAARTHLRELAFVRLR